MVGIMLDAFHLLLNFENQSKLQVQSNRNMSSICSSAFPVKPILPRTYPIFGWTNIDNNNIEPLNI